MTTLVIGASGFIGRSILRKIQGPVIAFDKVSTNNKFLREVEIVSSDVKNINDLLVGRKIQAIIYLSSATTSLDQFNLDEEKIKIDLENAKLIVNFCRANKVKKLIFASSGGVIYGAHNIPPFKEGMALYPRSIYGLTKMLLEKYFLESLSNSLTKVLILRVANPYGEGQNLNGSQGVIPIFLRKIANGETLYLRNRNSRRDYVYIDDVANAFHGALSYEGKENIFNIGGGGSIGLGELTSLLEIIVGKRAKIVDVPPVDTDLENSFLDISLAKSELSWAPEVNLKAGIIKTFNWISDEN
ncbi:NAD-dependent epimerase/dehydratase family protein [Polynucleobacter sp. UK-Kesae-W10]|uniref:NAD-dependent epimerase/dehydratase family protein n=1 Tax=Polynucleobacter sp. UK-Kesae-W10 TaxID=1819738 RepID=UPI001C0E0FF3|nr:NAD-dependent epimerase/dehydratase family protein [Polynucleobacter sp. UK-Kesae-W10]MBU3576952.1 NAD-dependent epimerase/dehydratase family protein [Polynucleobacter sp. UK-Kesae-W10]